MADDFSSELGNLPFGGGRGFQLDRQGYVVVDPPVHSEWSCEPFGIRGYVWRPLKGCEPNWFWRWMQYLAFGNRWTRGRR